MNQIGRCNRLIGLPVFCIELCVVILLAGCAPDGAGTVEEPSAVESGEQVFNENCGACHGADGRGPELAEIRALSSTERRDRIRNHPIAGQIPQRLPANQLANVIEYLETE